MKKLLIGTTALVAAGFVSGNASAADKIKLAVGGYMDQFIGVSENDNNFNGTTGAQNVGGFDVQADSEIFFSGSTKLDNGLTVGVKFEMEADGSQNTNMDSSSVSISSATLGTIDLGSDDNAADKMHNAPGTASKFGLELGDYAQWVQAPGAVTYNHYTRSTGASDYYGVSYRSPSFSGFQIGASYAAVEDENPRDNTSVKADEHMWTIAGAYSGKFDDVSVKADIYRAESGSDEQSSGNAQQGSTQTGGGLKIGFGAFEIAGAYKDVDQKKTAGNSSADGSVWSVGAGYKSGPMHVTVGWLRSEMEGTVNTTADDQVDLMTLQGAYDLGGGVKLSAAVSKAEFDDETTTVANNNDGWAAVAGVQVSF